MWLCRCSSLPPSLLQPERIDPTRPAEGYTVRADVWSFGITMVRVEWCACVRVCMCACVHACMRVVWLRQLGPLGSHLCRQDVVALLPPQVSRWTVPLPVLEGEWKMISCASHSLHSFMYVV